MNTAKKAIVIGTGAGGLMSAAYLAKYGFEVVALEKASSWSYPPSIIVAGPTH